MANPFVTCVLSMEINMTHLASHESSQCLSAAEQSNFLDLVINGSALACEDIHGKNFDLGKSVKHAQGGIAALNTIDGLKIMLAAQMLSIHQLQQQSMVLVNGIDNMTSKQYYTNTAIKLSNCFVQQASLLAKLQGAVGQTMMVGRVDVHEGGQAVVGNIHGTKQG